MFQNNKLSRNVGTTMVNHRFENKKDGQICAIVMVNKWDCWDMWNHHRIRWLTHKKKVNKIVGNKSTSYILKYKYFHAMAFCNNNQWIYIYIPRDISKQNYCKYKWQRIILLVIFLCIKITLRCLPVLQ